MNNNNYRRILSIDGGGVKGVIPVAFLSSIEENCGGEPIGSYFDLIVGTSTGGIIAAGLALGFKASDLLKFYVDNGIKIFPPINKKNNGKIKSNFKKLRQNYNNLFKSKYDSSTLENLLDELIGEKKIGEANTRLVIPSWDTYNRSVYVYKTAHLEKYRTDYSKPMKDAILATTAAPTIFSTHTASDQVRLLDGSVWANNPIAVAVTEAIFQIKWPTEEIRVLSLGCGNEVYTLSDDMGIIDVINHGQKLVLDGQSAFAQNLVKMLSKGVSDKKIVHRQSPRLNADEFKFDDPTKIDKLTGIGNSFARGAKNELIPVFFNDKVSRPYKKYHV